jgi:hypothetical protein
VAFEQWDQGAGRTQYDYAINGIPFLSGASKDNPYARSTAAYRKEQIDTSAEPGEQSLGGWWYRSQSSCDLGAGIKYFDTARAGDTISRRYADSHNVNPFTPGQVTLLNKAYTVSLPTTKKISYIAAYANEYDYAGAGVGSPDAHAITGGYLVVADNELYRVTQFKNGYQPGNQPYVDFSIKKIFELTRVIEVPTPETEITNLIVVGKYYYFTVNANTPLVYRGSIESWAAPTVLYQASQQIFAPASTRVAGQFPAYQPSFRTKETYRPNSLIGYAKGLLWITFGSYLWTVSPTPTETAPINLVPAVGIDVDSKHLTFIVDGYPTAIVDGPSGVYISTVSKSQVSRIYTSTIDDTAGGLIATLNAAYVIAELPGGEEITSMLSYLGTYLAIGTDRGVRFAAIDGGGRIVMGPLNTESDMPVEALYADGNFVWAGGALSDGYSGLYRIDMSRPTSQQEYRFAWSKDFNSSSTTTVDSSQIVGVASATPGYDINDFTPGVTPVDLLPARPLAFATGTALYVENPRMQVDSGWLQTGRIRFDTTEKKNFEYLRVNYISGSVTNPSGGGRVLVYDDFGLIAAHACTNGIDEQYFDAYGSSTRTSLLSQSYRFVLVRDQASNTGPTFKSYQVKAQPAGIRQRSIRLPLLCMPIETSYTGQTANRSVWDRISQLETLEESGATVLFQDFGTGEERAAIIEEMQFIAVGQPTTRAQKADPGGIVVVTLRTVDESVHSSSSIIATLAGENSAVPVIGANISTHRVIAHLPKGRTRYDVYVAEYPDGVACPISAGIGTFNNTTNTANTVSTNWTADISFAPGWYVLYASAIDLVTHNVFEVRQWFELDSDLNVIAVTDTDPLEV